MLLASEDIKQKQNERTNERQRPFSPSVPAEAGCLFTVEAFVNVFITVDFAGDLSAKHNDPTPKVFLVRLSARSFVRSVFA